MKAEESIKNFIKQCRDKRLALPNFQRDYIWNKKKVISFLNSIHLKYPIGLIIIWKTTKIGREFGPLENYPKYISAEGLVIDGQQRLTTLFLIEKDGRIKLKSERGVIKEYYFYFNKDTKKFEANDESIEDKNMIDAQEIISGKKQKQFCNYTLPIKYISAKNDLEALEIFKIVNTSGTLVSKTELALSKLKEKHHRVEREIIKFQKEFMEEGFDLSNNVIINSFNVVINIKDYGWSPGTRNTDKRIDEYLKKTNNKDDILHDLKKTLNRIEDAIKLIKSAGFDSVQFLTSENIIATICGYLEVKNLFGQNLNKTNIKNKIRRWIYKNILTNRYSNTTNFNNDLRELRNHKKLSEIREGKSWYKNIESVLSVMYALGIRRNMKDYESEKITWRHSKSAKRKIHIDHIYPFSRLKNEPISMEEDVYDSYGNKAFIMGKENMSKNKHFPGERIKKTKIKDVNQWLKGHNFLKDEDYKKMCEHESVLKKNKRYIEKFIRKREKKIVSTISKEL